jgi:hypothetical protein
MRFASAFAKMRKGYTMAALPHLTGSLDPTRPDPELFSIEIGLFDESEHEDDHIVVPLSRYLQELRQPVAVNG